MEDRLQESIRLYEEAVTLLPGGVDSPARAFKSVGGQPLFIRSGAGARITDVDGNSYIDYILSFGPLILGHAPQDVVEAIAEAARQGTSFGATSPLELELARLVQHFFPSMGLVRFVNSGTEATMSVLRLARAFTGRDKIIKFSGNYHGHADMLLVQAGSGVATLGLPDSPGVPAATTSNTIVLPYNDLESLSECLEDQGDSIAGVILEPVAGNMGLVPPAEGYLEGIRKLTTDHEVLLIFDEVMSGFRVHPGGAQALYNVQPDLTALGKVIGGGLPVGAYGGRKDIMVLVAPSGPMYQAGTLSGNPLAMTAGIVTLRRLMQENLWDSLEARCKRLVDGIGNAAKDAALPICQTRQGTMFCTYFTETPVTDFASASQSDTDLFARVFKALLRRGVLLPPSQFETCFISTEHDDSVIDETIDAVAAAFRDVTTSVSGAGK